MSRIFISYRREDTAGHAGRLFDRLSGRYGRDRVFMDVDTIGAGVDFVETVRAAVASCDIFIVLIGRRWLTTGEGRTSRLEDPDDFVRLEIATALAGGGAIIPVLVDGSSMPGVGDLPRELEALARRNALELSDARWDHDIDRLFTVVGDVAPEQALTLLGPPAAAPAAEPTRKRWPLIAAGALLALAVAAAAWWLWPRSSADPTAEAATEAPSSVPVVGVAPLENLASQEALEWFGDGIANLVREDLAESRHLAVVSPTRMQRLQGEGQNEAGILQAAAAGGIGYFVTGEYFPSGQGTIIVTARLTDIEGAVEIDSRRLEVTEDELLGVWSEISLLARSGLGVPLEDQLYQFAADFAVGNPAAYEAYVSGLREFLQFHYDDAETAFRLALELAPEFTMARYRLAHIQASTSRIEQALATIAQAVAEAATLSPREAAYVKGAEAYFAGRYDEAAEIYRSLLESYPYEVEARFSLARVLRNAKRLSESAAELRVLSQREPNNPSVWSFLGGVYMELGELDMATEAVERYVDLEPDSANAHDSLADLYRHRGQLEAAERELRTALELDPGFVRSTLDLAVVEALRGRARDAEARLQGLLSASGTHPRYRIDASFDLASLMRASGRFAGAAAVLERVENELRDERVREAMALAIRGVSLLQSGDTDAAAKLIDQAVERSPGIATRYLFARGLLELHLGQTDDVRRTAERILADAPPPENPNRREEKAAAYVVGLALLEEGQSEAAVRELERAVALEGYEYSVYRLGLARALLAAGRLSEALQAAESAAAPPDPSAPRLDLELDRRRALLVQAEIQQAMGDSARAAELAVAFLQAYDASAPEDPLTISAQALVPR